MNQIADLSNSDLMIELKNRGYVVSLWSFEDTLESIYEKFPDETEDRAKNLATALLAVAKKKLLDKLCQCGDTIFPDVLELNEPEVIKLADEIEAKEQTSNTAFTT